jgi:replication factor C subunit 1
MYGAMLSNTIVSLCGIPNPETLISFLSFHNNIVKSWTPNISALIIGATASGKWKYTEASRLGIRILTVAEVMPESDSDLWVTRYAPKTLSDVIGHADAIKTLLTWLNAWTLTTTPRATLITGPPGIGKTTLAHLVAAACSYGVVELNASNERSASAVRRWFEEASSAGHVGKRRVVIMDEVDGMSSGDRGGMGELARIIRKCAFPIICIGNERTAPKMRPLVSCCLDVRCARPPRGTIAKRLMSSVVIPAKLKYTQERLEELCERNGNDIRQILNFLQFDVGSGGTKDELQRVDPFSAAGRLFGGAGQTIDQRLGLVFVDFGLVPLMVAEGYVAAAGKRIAGGIERCAAAGSYLGMYDVMDRALRRTMNWVLLPSVLLNIVGAAAAADGPAPFQIFPSWLGKNSKRLKHRRMLTTMRRNGRFGSDMNLVESRSLLRARLFRHKDATDVVNDLVSLGLTRDDMLDTLVDTTFSDEVVTLDSKLKAGITREWKKRGLDAEVSKMSGEEDGDGSDEEDEMLVEY